MNPDGRRRLLRSHQAAVRATTALGLGLRKIRASCAEQIAAWKELYALQVEGLAQGGVPPSLSTTPGTDALTAWANSSIGLAVIGQMRWQVIPLTAVCAHVRPEVGIRFPRDDRRVR